MTAPPFEYLPGRWADDAFVRWREAPARPSAQRLRHLSTSEPDASATLTKQPGAWTRQEATHFARRLGFGATPEAIEALTAMTQAQAVDAVVDAAVAASDLPTPDWISEAPPEPPAPPEVIAAYNQANKERVEETEWGVYRRMLGDGHEDPIQALGIALRERIALVWHDHFVTELDAYTIAPWLHRYWSTLRDGALGDFRVLVHRIGLEPAMLCYLNGADNRAGQPNENYARELLELFTMGILAPDGSPNYAERDIQELSRALTGWSVDAYGDLNAHFVEDWHDTGRKRIFGQRGRWDYDDVVPLLFAAREAEIAAFVCRKLYRAFAREDAPANLVGQMAQVLIATDWRIESVLRAMFSSSHFVSDEIIGAKIKSPLENAVGLYRSVRRRPQPRRRKLIREITELAGQTLFDPPDVAGWPGHRDWINTSRIATRWWGTEKILQAETDLRAVALALPDPSTPSRLAADLAELFLGLPVSDANREAFTEILLGGIPAASWDPAADGAEARLVGLVVYLASLPEHELV
ncbi:MAG: DUF1800 family protein [Bacteroidota bacterium]